MQMQFQQPDKRHPFCQEGTKHVGVGARMAQRTRTAKSTQEHLRLTVTDAAVFVRHMQHGQPQADVLSGTKIRIEGQSGGSASKVIRETLLLVAPEDTSMNVPGYALGGKTPWTVSCQLPLDQFANLLTMVLAGKLHAVDMAFDEVRWHKGTLLSIKFATRPLPSEGDRAIDKPMYVGGCATEMFYPARVLPH